MLRNIDFYRLQRSYLTNVKNKIGYTRLVSLKTATKKVVHKTVEFVGNKIAEAKTNSYYYEISTLLNDSTILKFVTKKWIERNDLSSIDILPTKI